MVGREEGWVFYIKVIQRKKKIMTSKSSTKNTDNQTLTNMLIRKQQNIILKSDQNFVVNLCR